MIYFLLLQVKKVKSKFLKTNEALRKSNPFFTQINVRLPPVPQMPLFVHRDILR